MYLASVIALVSVFSTSSGEYMEKEKHTCLTQLVLEESHIIRCYNENFNNKLVIGIAKHRKRQKSLFSTPRVMKRVIDEAHESDKETISECNRKVQNINHFDMYRKRYCGSRDCMQLRPKVKRHRIDEKSCMDKYGKAVFNAVKEFTTTAKIVQQYTSKRDEILKEYLESTNYKEPREKLQTAFMRTYFKLYLDSNRFAIVHKLMETS